jgi:hypothetical protein
LRRGCLRQWSGCLSRWRSRSRGASSAGVCDCVC